MKILMISGKSGSGKDAIAFLLKEKLTKQNCKIITIHFADLVKYYAVQYFNWDGEKNEEGRALLQRVGTTIMRGYDEDYWARIVSEFLAAIDQDYDYALIPDWRFINEYEVMAEYNKYIVTIRVNRYDENGNPYINPNFTPEQIAHISENQLDEFCFDYIVENKGDLTMLEEAVETILHEEWRK